MNTSNAYDNCDSAIVMCGPGALVDRASVLREFDPNDTFVGGQITKNRLKSTDGKEIYEYRMYTYSNEYVVLDPLEDAITIADCENMITYHVSDGTVMLNPVGMEDEPVTVYAYTYIDSVDEKLLQGRRVMPIETPGHANASTSVYSTNRTHLYDLGVNALSTYLNGVMIPHVEETTTDVKSDIFFVDKPFSSMFIPFVNRYEVEKTDNILTKKINGTALESNTVSNNNTDANFLLFLSGSDYGKYKIYSCKLYKSNQMVRNFIPCYRKADNEIGMYSGVSLDA
jgi:hypothetical protein